MLLKLEVRLQNNHSLSISDHQYGILLQSLRGFIPSHTPFYGVARIVQHERLVPDVAETQLSNDSQAPTPTARIGEISDLLRLTP